MKKQTLDQSIIKINNRSNILRAFREKEIIQKKELVKLLQLSITTVTSNTRMLLDEGFIEETGIAESTGGRKPVVFKFIKDAKVSFGVDISPHQVMIILTNLSSEIIDQRKFPVQDEKIELILDKIILNIEEMLQLHGYSKENCMGVGLSLPGIVDEEENILINAPNLNIRDYDFNDFKQQIGLEIYIENEANAAAFAELIMGSASDIENAVYISITDGVGCGIIANKMVSKGSFKKAGEFGHMRISDQDVLCSCGRKGCWEIFSSERGLYKNYAALSGNIVSDLETFFNLYHSDNQLAKLALKNYFDYLVIGIENIILGLDPEVVIVGGEIAKYLKEIEPLINEYMKHNHSTIKSGMNKLVFSNIAPQSAVIGSSLLPLKDMFGY